MYNRDKVNPTGLGPFDLIGNQSGFRDEPKVFNAKLQLRWRTDGLECSSCGSATTSVSHLLADADGGMELYVLK